MKVLNAILREVVYFGRKEGYRIDITTMGESKPLYDQLRISEHEWILRGEDGDVGHMACLNDNHNGFGGCTQTYKLKQGGYIIWKGAWSSRAGVINQLWPNEEPLVECVDTSRLNIVTHVRKDVLERLGIKLKREIPWDGEIYYRPVL